jgi:hypothetical protein
MIKGKFPAQQVLGVVAGSVAAGFVGKLVTKFMPTASETVKALVPLAAGVFLAMQKNEIVKGAGFGMVAAGGSALVDAFMPAGVSGVDDYFMNGDDEGMYGDEDFMNGNDDFVSLPADQSILSAPADQSILSGYGDESGMYGDDDVMNGEEEFMNAYDGGSYQD